MPGGEAASLLSFTKPQVVTLFSLVPGTNVGYPAIAMGIVGLLFTSAGLRSILADPQAHRRVRASSRWSCCSWPPSAWSWRAAASCW
jgi:hypothetical protein